MNDIDIEAQLERLMFLWDRLTEEVREREDGMNPIVWPDREDVYWCRRCDSYHRTDIPREHAARTERRT